jgi:hypothetical protein
MVTHYASLTEDVLDRCRVAAEESRNGSYTPQRLFSDMMASWWDMMRGLSYPMKWYDSVQAEIVVPIALDPLQATAVGAIMIANPGSTALSVAPLTTKDAIPAVLTAVAHVVERPRRTLVVVVTVPKTPGPTKGTYTGSVETPDGKKIALVEVTVP